VTRGEMRLRVMHSLPDRHLNYVSAAVRERCGEYVARTSFGISADELLSQLWVKFMSGASATADELGESRRWAND
jgi:hypothetical protein